MTSEKEKHVKICLESGKEKISHTENFEKSKKSEETDTNSNVDSMKILDGKKKANDAESEESSHIKNVDLYDRLNFQRIQNIRSSKKSKTNMCALPKFNIQRITDELYKYVEDLEPVKPQQSDNLVKRKRTIKFSTQKVTYQYPKIKEVITNNFSVVFDEHNEEDEKKEDDKDKDIFIFNENDEHDQSHEQEAQDEKPVETEKTEKKHINLEVYEEK